MSGSNINLVGLRDIGVEVLGAWLLDIIFLSPIRTGRRQGLQPQQQCSDNYTTLQEPGAAI